MAQVTVPPVGDLVSGLSLPPTQRVTHHDQVSDAGLSRPRSNRWLRPAADITASLLALVIAACAFLTLAMSEWLRRVTRRYGTSSGTTTLSKNRLEVTEARRLILCLMTLVVKPLKPFSTRVRAALVR